MIIWEVVFFPPLGKKYSPADVIRNIDRQSDAANIQKRLETISRLTVETWPSGWIKRYSQIYQLTSGNYRVYFCTDKRRIVVCHVCRKVSQKAKQEDIDRAKINFWNYCKEERDED